MMRKLAIVAAAAGLAACGTKDAPDPLSPQGATGRVRFVNVITDTTRGRVNAILEGVPFGVNLTYGQSTPATLPAPSTANYSAILTGSRSLVLKRTADTNTVVTTVSFSVDQGQDYTIYATGGASGTAVTSAVVVDANADVLTSTQTRLRAVNMSPTGGAMDVFVTAPNADLATATPTFANVAVRGGSSYATVNAGTYQVRAVPAGTAPAARAAAVAINIASLALPGGSGRTIVLADRSVGGAPLTSFVLTDR
jgi:hypothetical protein